MSRADSKRRVLPTASHWGNFLVEAEGNDIRAVHNYPEDETPSEIGQSLLDSRHPDYRITQPMMRKSYREVGVQAGGGGRGHEPFVAVSWEEALDCAAAELERVRMQYGNASIYGGSYGWASAGRFHHAQSQMHRFLNCIGGYTASDKTYSAAAAEVLLPHILGTDLYTLFLHTTPWKEVAEHGELVVCFGGMNPKNLQVVMGGPGAHITEGQLQACRDQGVRFINISPLESDLPGDLNPDWIAIRPGTDTALILALCHTIISEKQHDQAFLERYCVGFDIFCDYLFGSGDGVVKSAEWAAHITEVPADVIRDLARAMASHRTFVPMGWSLQRAEHGEQPFWAGTALLCVLGQIGLPGAGIGHGVGSLHTIGFMGRRLAPFKWGAFEQGKNPSDSVIPVARVTDMLESPGAAFDYDGKRLSYPDVHLVYWAGGNPFHHHQDLNRLRRAWQKPDTIIINEQVWTATARHADIVFPITTSLERNDVSFNTFDPYISPMPQAVEPYAQARHDYDVFCGLAERLGCLEAFSENRSEMEWVEHIYQQSSQSAAAHGVELPAFDEFWQGEHLCLSDQYAEQTFLLESFRQDPEKYPLGTPSGKIEIYCETIASFAYADCPGHPVWLEKQECLGTERAKKYPLHMISNQPAKRLHSQLDFAEPSMKTKVAGREAVMLHPADAATRGIKDGDTVKVFNDRGACLAGAIVSERIRPSVIQMATGAWYDPIEIDEQTLDLAGNPNVLTKDIGTSSLGQGPISHSCLVDIELYDGPAPAPRISQPPEIIHET